MIKDLFLKNKLTHIGLGTYKIVDQDEMNLAIKIAYESGYRLFDSAMLYKNEAIIGNAVKLLKIPREEIFLTTKLDKKSMGYDKAKFAIRKSLRNFQTDYLEIVLIHWPLSNSLEVWMALEELCEMGMIKYIGVSNFKEDHLRILLEKCKIRPAVNQIELHPLYYDKKLVEYCNKERIQVQAYTPLAKMNTKLIENEDILKISSFYNKKPTQVILKWGIQHNWCVLPKSVKKDRIIENIQLDDFNLTEEEMITIDNLNINIKIINNPKCDNFS